MQKNLYDLLKKDIKLTDLSIRTIFRDCQTFKKRKEYHPYSKVCDKYKENEYKQFKNDFYNNFKIENPFNSFKYKVKGLLTGYYEPAIKAYSFQKDGTYPIYKHPGTSLEKLRIDVTRKEINNGYLRDRNLEIAWVENEIEAFFLHIQGSGRLILDGEKIVKVRFAGSNNKKYTSLGKILVDKGYLSSKEIDMYKIKEWLHKNKVLAQKFMNMNERYIFFEEYKGKIRGSGGVDLVSNVSVAVDKRYFKKGEAVIIQNESEKKDIIIGIAHDEGAAIKGHSRIDLFLGFGMNAEKKAAKLKKKIFAWKLVPM